MLCAVIYSLTVFHPEAETRRAESFVETLTAFELTASYLTFPQSFPSPSFSLIVSHALHTSLERLDVIQINAKCFPSTVMTPSLIITFTVLYTQVTHKKLFCLFKYLHPAILYFSVTQGCKSI